MAMKETEGSLRAYFILAGGISAFWAWKAFSEMNGFDLTGLPALHKAALYVPIVTRLLLGIGFVVAGIRLTSALLTDVSWIKTMLVISGAMLFINGALVTTAFGLDIGRSGVLGAAVGLAITIYLHRSVTHIAEEARTKAGMSPPPPTARVV